ncbi:MAG: hypothetical protein LC793_21900 [Thermomicrobia bacterium]|nr:hypothetical protein [Thermomicrobia bacterium]MCA1725736.1 hypothetical protein [Thermomicrobia bacterium]
MDYRTNPFDFTPEYAITCDICGAAIGTEYVNIAAEDETGAIIGTLIAHPRCAERLNPSDVAALLGAAVGGDEDDLDALLPLERCCLCGGPIADAGYLNLIEAMHPGVVDGPLVATSFHLACYRDDPDGVQRALDEEVMEQRARRMHGSAE